MYYGINIKSIIKVIGILLCIEAVFMLIPVITALIYEETDLIPFLQSFGITIATGAAMLYLPRNANERIGKREGFLIVTFSWIAISIMGALPFLLNGNTHTFTDAFFEAISGFTTTGVTVLSNLNETTHGILIWRNLMQWMGGMGIILFTVAILPMLNSGGGIQLFSAEMTGIVFDKLGPRISQTAKKLWGLYFGMTLVLIFLLQAGPMNTFDAICTAFSTTSTGGFSTKDQSLAYWNSAYIEYTVTIFMFLSAVNFAIIYKTLFRSHKELFKDEEFKWFAAIVAAATLITTLSLYFQNPEKEIEEIFRKSLFTIVSGITSTGFAVENFCNWGSAFFVIICVCMFFGGCAGSTAGGAKITRLVLLFKNTDNEFYRQIHPTAIRPVRFNGKVVSHDLISKVLAFIVMYILLAALSAMILSLMNMTIDEAIGVSLSALGNCGFGFGRMNPDSNFIMLPTLGKWIVIFDMLIGRLEIFTVLILFSPYFWRK